jgi:hypothetical protein
MIRVVDLLQEGIPLQASQKAQEEVLTTNQYLPLGTGLKWLVGLVS